MKRILILVIGVSIFLFQGLSQGENLVTEELQPPVESSNEFLYAGEVVSINSETNELNVQYYDYETDILKEIIFQLDDFVRFENVKGLDEINIGDTVNVEYVQEGNKNIARKISVEKNESENILPW